MVQHFLGMHKTLGFCLQYGRKKAELGEGAESEVIEVPSAEVRGGLANLEYSLRVTFFGGWGEERFISIVMRTVARSLAWLAGSTQF